MKFVIQKTGMFKGEAWVEVDGKIVCEATLVLIPPPDDNILIDQIDTMPGFRRRGYATFLVKTILQHYPNCQPTTIENNEGAKAFWKSLGLEPALGWEDD